MYKSQALSYANICKYKTYTYIVYMITKDTDNACESNYKYDTANKV